MDHSIRGHFWAQWKSESWCMPSSPEKAARMCLPRVSSRSLTMRHEYENTLKSFAAAGGKKGKFFSLPELARQYPQEIGRASCRERMEISVVAVFLKKKKPPILGDRMDSQRKEPK